MTLTLRTVHSTSPPCTVVTVDGELDAGTAPALRECLVNAATDSTRDVVVDLSGVTFADCAGLRPLLDARAHPVNRVRLRALPRRVLELMHLIGQHHAARRLPAEHGAAAREHRRPEEAWAAAVRHLSEQAPLDLWLLTRVEGADQVVLAAEGVWAPDLPVGTSFPWLGSFGLHMAAGVTPAVAVSTRDVPLYAAASTGRWAHVRAYSGTPIMGGEGQLFGVLAGFSGHAGPEVADSASIVQVLGLMLSGIATAQHDADRLRTELTGAHDLAETDALTQLSNRRGWHRALAQEIQRRARYAEPVGILVIDLDDLKAVNDSYGHVAGDELLRATAAALTGTCRPSDIIGRTGGDEFAVLVLEAGPDQLDALSTRIRDHLDAAGIRASLGGAIPLPGEDLVHTWARADQAMYTEKRRRLHERGATGSTTASAP